MASLDALTPIVVTPLLGKWVEKNGYRMELCALAGVCAALGFGAILHGGVSPVLAMALLSVNSCTTPALVKSAVPLVAPTHALGTAFSTYYVFESLGQAFGHVVLGWARDATGSYDGDVSCLLVVSLLSAKLAVAIRLADRKWAWGLESAKAAAAADVRLPPAPSPLVGWNQAGRVNRRRASMGAATTTTTSTTRHVSISTISAAALGVSGVSGASAVDDGRSLEVDVEGEALLGLGVEAADVDAEEAEAQAQAEAQAEADTEAKRLLVASEMAFDQME